MAKLRNKVMIMAGGTGGHIFPALAIARELQTQGLDVEWLGGRTGLETELVGNTDIPLHQINARGIAGKGMIAVLRAPWMILRATFEAWSILRSSRPDCVLGMGGFVTGPGAVAARLLGIRLLIHEQNAVPGFTNNLLSRFAWRIMESFPQTFAPARKAIHTGNPLRNEILQLAERQPSAIDSERALHLLVLGGSQGAQSINELIPVMLQHWQGARRPHVLHQTGKANLAQTLSAYDAAGDMPADVEVRGFIDDMAAAYRWADLVIGRSGATTVCELAVAGMPSLLVPYPWHRDQQQLHNARWLELSGAAIVLPQDQLNVTSLCKVVQQLDAQRQTLVDMAASARRLGIADATQRIVAQCREAANV